MPGKKDEVTWRLSCAIFIIQRDRAKYLASHFRDDSKFCADDRAGSLMSVCKLIWRG